MKYCKYCGKKVDDNVPFCCFCGKNLVNKIADNSNCYNQEQCKITDNDVCKEDLLKKCSETDPTEEIVQKKKIIIKETGELSNLIVKNIRNSLSYLSSRNKFLLALVSIALIVMIVNIGSSYLGKNALEVRANEYASAVHSLLANGNKPTDISINHISSFYSPEIGIKNQKKLSQDIAEFTHLLGSAELDIQWNFKVESVSLNNSKDRGTVVISTTMKENQTGRIRTAKTEYDWTKYDGKWYLTGSFRPLISF